MRLTSPLPVMIFLIVAFATCNTPSSPEASGRGRHGARSRGVSVETSSSLGGEIYQPYRRKVALVVGIDQYSNGDQPLKFAQADAEAVYTLLVESLGFEEVILLKDQHATRECTLRAIEHLRTNGLEEDGFIFFFGGHGVSFGEGAAQRGYLLPQDAKGTDEASAAVTGISMIDLRDSLEKLPAKHVLILVDACFGGYMAVAPRGGPEMTSRYLKVITANRVRQILTAGLDRQPVFESSEWQHSAFTYGLLEALGEGKADGEPADGLIVAPELFSYLQKRVHHLTGGLQTPGFAKLVPGEGEFVFVLEEGRRIAAGQTVHGEREPFDPTTCEGSVAVAIPRPRPIDGIVVDAAERVLRGRVSGSGLYAVCLVQPESDGRYFVQNVPVAVAPGQEFSIRLHFGARGRHNVALALTKDQDLFQLRQELRDLPQRDRGGEPVTYLNARPVTIEGE